MKEKSKSPLFNASNGDNEDRAMKNQEVHNKHSNENKNASNGQILHSISVTSQNNSVNHNQISAASTNSFTRTIGSRQSSPTNDSNIAGAQLHSTQCVNSDKTNSVNISNVQHSGSVPNSITNDSSLISSAGSVAPENQQGPVTPATTQQINIDTSGLSSQVPSNYLFWI